MSSSKSIIKRQKNRRYGKNSKKSNSTAEPALESLDRFAGSSEEENDDNDDDDNNNGNDEEANESDDNANANLKIEDDKQNDTSVVKSAIGSVAKTSRKNITDADTTDNYEGENESESDDEDDDNDDDEMIENDDSNDIEPQFQLTTGMANAMNRILSAPVKQTSTTSRAAVVLSKTKTPLQVQAEKEKKVQDSLKESRRVKRERQIKAIHIPLTVATNSNSNYSSSLTTELEIERTHRRVATRGIVALFNAIAQHQVRPDQTAQAAAAAVAAASAVETTKKMTATTTPATTKLTKHGFLDLIKQKAIKSTSMYDAKTPKSITLNDDTGNNVGDNDAPKSIKKWNALKDDYMMDSTKNWDELDDDDDNDDDEKDRMPSHKSPRKKVRHNSRN